MSLANEKVLERLMAKEDVGMAGLEKLKVVCRERGVRVVKEKHIVFGEGVLFDKDPGLVIVSKGATAEDIKMATDYTEKNIQKSDYILTA